MSLLPAPSALLGFRAVCSCVTLLSAVEALVGFGTVILHMTLFPTLPADFRLWAVGTVVAFLTAVEALAWLIVSSIIAHLVLLADRRGVQDKANRTDSLKKCYQA